MRKTLTIIFLLSSWLAWAQSDLPQRPSPPRLVNDLTGSTLSAREANALERKLLSYEDTTSTQVAILIVNSLNGYEVVDYAQRVGQNWGVGQANRDNGVFIVVAVDDRKAAIVTGYGMEGAITDAATYTIREEYMNPRFRQNDFYGGLDDATDVIFKLASGEFKADEVARGRSRGEGGRGIPFGFLFILFFFILPAIAGRRRRRGIGSRGIPWWAWLMMGSSMGGRRDNNWDNFRGGGGGFGGGSGFGGGGGFGGFGGGSFGGGGSGGSW